ncbi:hypothetical protein [Streptomyces wuyuanensis]|uniref:hypothetical protein n=1 Tax=Streptomyces wuyuanensis TaxID=1196353 RepID=UPI00368E7F59
MLRALRTTADLTVAEARARAGEPSGTGLVGTPVETDLPALGLRDRGLAVVVERAPWAPDS